MNKLRKKVTLFSTIMFMILGYYGVLYGTGELIYAGAIYCGVFGLMMWMNWSQLEIQNK